MIIRTANSQDSILNCGDSRLFRAWKEVRMISQPRFKVLLLLATLALVSLATASYSQTETGQITGTVFDPTGAAIPNAKITVKAVATGLERQTTTTGVGTYAVLSLLVRPGFGQQDSGAINGVVADETGAVLPGVTVTVTNTSTNRVQTTITGSDGTYY